MLRTFSTFTELPLDARDTEMNKTLTLFLRSLQRETKSHMNIKHSQ